MNENQPLAMTLDGFATPCLILDGDRQILFRNRAALEMLQTGNGLREIQGRLELEDGPAGGELEACMQSRQDACASETCTEIPCEIPLPDSTGNSPRLLVLSRLPDSSNEPRFAAYILGSVAHLNLQVGMSRLRRLFGMTRSEAEIATRLVQGESPREIAKARCTSEQTVRTQIKMVLQKAGCRRQIDLMRLLPLVLSRAGQGTGG